MKARSRRLASRDLASARSPLVSVLVALALAGCAAAPSPGAVNADLGGGPRALVRESSHDFGTVESGTVVQQRFEIANVGDQPLDISSVSPSCGCTAAIASDKTIWPGSTGAVEVSLDTYGLSGPQSKAVRVRTSDPSVAETTLTLHGEVAGDVTVKPSRVYLGRIGRERSLRRSSTSPSTGRT